jgi:hypothetical protein
MPPSKALMLWSTTERRNASVRAALLAQCRDQIAGVLFAPAERLPAELEGGRPRFGGAGQLVEVHRLHRAVDL